MPPTLAIAKTAPAQALLQWLTNYAGFKLQSAPSLHSLWTPITNGITINGLSVQAAQLSSGDVVQVGDQHFVGVRP